MLEASALPNEPHPVLEEGMLDEMAKDSKSARRTDFCEIFMRLGLMLEFGL